MRNTLVTMLTASILVAAAVVGMPSSAQSQVIIIVGNGQPYYPPPYPHPYPYDRHVVFGGYYSGYGYYPHPHPHPYPYPSHHPVVSGGYYPEYGYSNGEGEAYQPY